MFKVVSVACTQLEMIRLKSGSGSGSGIGMYRPAIV